MKHKDTCCCDNDMDIMTFILGLLLASGFMNDYIEKEEDEDKKYFNVSRNNINKIFF